MEHIEKYITTSYHSRLTKTLPNTLQQTGETAFALLETHGNIPERFLKSPPAPHATR
jgi:hypothetical protein